MWKLTYFKYIVRTEKITHDHSNWSDGTGFKEEECPGYFKQGFDLFASKCQLCHLAFEDGGKDINVITVTVNKPAYFCIGWDNFGCQHGYCHNCFWKKHQ